MLILWGLVRPAQFAVESVSPELVGSFIDRYGLPLAILAMCGWLVLTRRFVTGSELLYVEERRKEEREGRLAAEATVKVLAEGFQTIGGSMEQIAETVTDAVDRALEADRREGRPRAGR